MDRRTAGRIRALIAIVASGAFCHTLGADDASAPGAPALPLANAFVAEYCLDCHESGSEKGDLALDVLTRVPIDANAADWERVVRKLRRRAMPPPGKKHPDDESYERVIGVLEGVLDRASASHPRPGRTSTFRRLTRIEYQNAIRDLLALEIDAAALLPLDDASHGFDNVTAGDLSPTLLDRYLSAALKISRIALGRAPASPDLDVFRIRPDLTQEKHIEGLPLGTRGGAVLPYNFPVDGEYEFRVRLARDRDEHVEGLGETHELEILIDRELVKSFTIEPPRREADHETADSHLHVRASVPAGHHEVGVTFVKRSSALIETIRQPYNAHFNRHRHPRLTPAVFQVSIGGPFAAEAPSSRTTATRRRIFGDDDARGANDDARAQEILARLLRRAYRRPVEAEDLEKSMTLFRRAAAADGFEAGIELALSAILVSPHFLFRVERDPEGIAPETPYRVSDVELASRLSFFLWSSIPDDELLDLAARGELHQANVLEGQVKRMLADPRSRSLATNFASQWLYLRNLDGVSPDQRLFPDFDDNLRQAFRDETELFFDSIVREDRSVLDLIASRETFLNERLARHYGIPHVIGSRFRRVALDGQSERGGLLRQGSILTITSYATRTSPVLRGKWILENILGSPPPPPPAEVPALEESVSEALPVRERLVKHRADPACASCHQLMDPVGFALEGFDAVGRRRVLDAGQPVDTSGELPDGTELSGPGGLEENLLRRPEIFVETLVEKLLTFALGRGVEPTDGPAIRRILRRARNEDFRFSSIALGIAMSAPFQMRESE